jgi:predicted enzyme related to lactoylglutathione lyase
MLKKLRTITYHVDNLQEAKEWYSDVFGITPYFDEPFYVGFDIGGCELGLDPDGSPYSNGQHNITYWLVDDLKASVSRLIAKNVEIHQQPAEVGGGILIAGIKDPFNNIIGLIEVPETEAHGQ